jgi:hypothetical protein
MSAGAVFSATAAGQAATIDFTDSSTAAAANGKSTYTYNNVQGTGVNVTVTAGGVAAATIAAQAGTGLLADGLGVTSSVDGWTNPTSFIKDDWESTKDEINGAETLTVKFSSPVTIQSIKLTDLYANPDTGAYTWVPDETGKWSLLDSKGKAVATGQFTGVEERNPDGSSNSTATPTNGVLSVNIGQTASGVVFQSTNSGMETQFKGFSVASITFDRATGVPELSSSGASSAAVLILGASVLFTGNRRRRNTQAKS